MKKTWLEPQVLSLDMQATFGGTELTFEWDGFDWNTGEPDLTGEPQS